MRLSLEIAGGILLASGTMGVISLIAFGVSVAGDRVWDWWKSR